MVLFQVEVTSRELVKPTSPTPSHLKTLRLSFLEQFSPPLYIPLLFFYQNEADHNPIHNQQRLLLLKQSLSDALVLFYPLAGRVNGRSTIDCNDEGVEFYEANVSSNLVEAMEDPNMEDLLVLLPFETVAFNRNTVLGVQVNHFSCGGMAISVCISHKIADGTAAVEFLRAWAAMARGSQGDDRVMTRPSFNGASYFPPIEYNGIFMIESIIYKGKLVTRRLVFDKKKLEALKSKATSTTDPVKSPTRVEVVSAFIWRLIMEVAQNTTKTLDPGAFSRGIHAVNLRDRITPSIPKDSFGNFWWFAMTEPVTTGPECTEPELVRVLREAIRKVDGKSLKVLQNRHDCVKKMEEEIVGITETCRFSSWIRFPLYEVDFGWGEPTRVCTTTLPFRNLVILTSTSCGEGIEAWVNLVEEDMAMLESHLELLQFSPR